MVFIFVLSGFVIAYAYEMQLSYGIGVGRFAPARLVRLYPDYLLSLIAGALAVWVHQRPAHPSSFASHLVLNLFMLPSPFALDPTSTSPFPAGFHLLVALFELDETLSTRSSPHA